MVAIGVENTGFIQSNWLVISCALMLFLVGAVFGIAELAPDIKYDSDTRVIIRSLPAQDASTLQKYMEVYKDLSEVQYESISPGQRSDLQLRAGNIEEEIKGIQDGSEQIAVHLITCDPETRSCAFRVNGQATKALYEKEDLLKPNAVTISPNYVLKINSIRFNYCDDRRFCASHFQAYDIADVSVISSRDLSETK